MQTIDFPEIVSDFGSYIPPFTYHKLGAGHIHDTFLITDAEDNNFVLQRLNTKVFPHPEHIVDTHYKVYQHLLKQQHFPLQLPAPITTKNGGWLVKEMDGTYWRAMAFIPNTYAVERAETVAQARQAATAVGNFLYGLDGLNPAEITPALPGFHDSVQRFKQFEQAVEENLVNRLRLVSPEVEFVKAEAEVFYLVEALHFPIRVVHSDPKIGNLLFDNATHDAVAVLDWDTIMPGAIPGDFGDMLRTMAATCPEDEADLSKVGLDITLFTALVNGFIPPLRGLLTPLELDHLVTGARWIILEQMMRFLTDYINGDIYYKIAYPEHNLMRARNQMMLYQAIKMQEQELAEIVKKIAQLENRNNI